MSVNGVVKDAGRRWWSAGAGIVEALVEKEAEVEVVKEVDVMLADAVEPLGGLVVGV